MKVFISWSGTRSKKTAQLLRTWLPQILNEVDPWVSDDDIGIGGNWSAEIIANLNQSRFGIVCVTPGNRRREWLNFEAGAISKQVGDEVNKVAPFLIGFNSKQDLSGPLSRFQAIQPTKEEMLKLLMSLNGSLTQPRPAAAVEAALDVWWPSFEGPYLLIEQDVATATRPRGRSDSDKIDELLALARQILRTFDKNEASVALQQLLLGSTVRPQGQLRFEVIRNAQAKATQEALDALVRQLGLVGSVHVEDDKLLITPYAEERASSAFVAFANANGLSLVVDHSDDDD